MPSDFFMPLAQYGVLVLFIAAMVGSPGPANMSLMASGLAFGARPAVPFLLGTMSGFQMIFWLNVLGLYALLQSAPEVFQLLRWMCIGYILYLAWTIVRSGSRQAGRATRVPGFLRGFWVHPLNPKAYAMQIAAISQFVSPDRYLADALLTSLTFWVVGGALNGLWLVAGGKLRSATGNPSFLYTLQVVLAVVMVGSTIASLQMIPP
ncbi:LysE family translocator [Stappia sp. ES.058]|uniref:LysE family translocator n=1 Tax=Stappia sp. ES.058 TaxID=1881061 RepID=UPI00087D47D0|nr:LysE family translocator [Stappia sp. ES.058]SDU06002.1 Threonine/homoserine/homoserine lactone efflux protein [Stappia sp. ES.058]